MSARYALCFEQKDFPQPWREHVFASPRHVSLKLHFARGAAGGGGGGASTCTATAARRTAKRSSLAANLARSAIFIMAAQRRTRERLRGCRKAVAQLDEELVSDRVGAHEVAPIVDDPLDVAEDALD